MSKDENTNIKSEIATLDDMIGQTSKFLETLRNGPWPDSANEKIVSGEITDDGALYFRDAKSHALELGLNVPTMKAASDNTLIEQDLAYDDILETANGVVRRMEQTSVPTSELLSYKDLIFFTTLEVAQMAATPAGLKSCEFKVSTFGLGIKLQVDDDMKLIFPVKHDITGEFEVAEAFMTNEMSEHDGPALKPIPKKPAANAQTLA